MRSFINSTEVVSFGEPTGTTGSFVRVGGGGGEKTLILFTNDVEDVDDNDWLVCFFKFKFNPGNVVKLILI
jgi:hypothetical protein